GPRGDLIAVADEIVLIGLDRQRILCLERLEPALRHGEGIVGEVDLLLFLVPLEHRKVDDPGEFEALGIDEPELGANARARRAGERGRFRGVAGNEEDGIALTDPELSADRLGPLGPDIPGDRSRAFEGAALAAEEDVAEAGL